MFYFSHRHFALIYLCMPQRKPIWRHCIVISECSNSRSNTCKYNLILLLFSDTEEICNMSKQRSPSHFGFTKIIAKKMTVELCYIYFEEARKVSVAFVLSKLLNFSFNHFNMFPFFIKLLIKVFMNWLFFDEKSPDYF